ncbi:MAG: hypothetical protein CME70_19025 [Halobacteriovorax sp.]|nr:hypothetical protein [Halobacteriovorax sp.]|tara:strand:+ start:49 stop:561 length:513 start_codon:yes stop_codon:yes gene_type:complete
MKQELQDKLFEKYPKIFRQKDLSMQETAMCWGIETGDGWYNILNVLCTNIQQHIDWNNCTGKYEDQKQKFKCNREPIPQVEAVQVKEKYGGLRFYYHGGDDRTSGMIAMAEAMSDYTCEECGAPGKQNTKGWIRTLCNGCLKKYQEIQSKRWGELDTKPVDKAIKDNCND